MFSVPVGTPVNSLQMSLWSHSQRMCILDKVSDFFSLREVVNECMEVFMWRRKGAFFRGGNVLQIVVPGSCSGFGK